MQILTAEPVSDVRCELGEGPRWDAVRGEFVWVDIVHGAVRRASWQGGALQVIARYTLDRPVGAVTTVASGGYLAAAGTGFAYLGEDGSAREVATTPGAAVPVRMNDAQCDPHGRFWAGTMPYDSAHRGAGTLYRLEPGGAVTIALAHVTISNGLAWSADGTRLFYVDSADSTVWSFHVDDDGTLSGRHAHIVHSGDGVPDGICRDDDDHLWVAINGGGQVRRFDPSGRQVATVAVPGARQVSSCALGGEDGQTLFITTAFENLPDEERRRQSGAGLVHAVTVEVPGPAMTPFAGELAHT